MKGSEMHDRPRAEDAATLAARLLRARRLPGPSPIVRARVWRRLQHRELRTPLRWRSLPAFALVALVGICLSAAAAELVHWRAHSPTSRLVLHDRDDWRLPVLKRPVARPAPSKPIPTFKVSTAERTESKPLVVRTGHPDRAKPIPDDMGSGRDAVFVAARILRAGGDREKARRLLDDYLRSGREGELAEEAAYLSIEAAASDGARAAAARRYLEWFPGGTYRTAAERSLENFSKPEEGP